MKKFALALLVLALTVPASANVVLTSAVGTGADANLVTISYNNTGGEEVRAFALDVNAGGKLVVGSAAPVPVGGVIHYYVYPSSIQFGVTGSGETYISSLGSPMANQTAQGGVIEMASLYAAGDVNHPSAPPSSGALVKFRVNCSSGAVTVKVALNAQRGGVVLKDPNVTPTVTLPADLAVCGGPCSGMVVGGVCGGVPITQARYDNWIQLGQPQSWCHKGHYAGDVNMDCKITSTDVVGAGGFRFCFGKVWPDPLYNPAADTNDDKRITSADIIGDSTVPGGGLKPNWGKTIPSCP
jgi:hypothetical protein